MSHVRRNRKGERKKDVGISERRPTRSSHHGLRFAPHKRELTHKQPTTGLKHVSLFLGRTRTTVFTVTGSPLNEPIQPMPPSRFVRPVGFALLLGPSWNASRKRAGWRTAAPIEGNADLGVAARVLQPFFSRISYLADLVRVGRPVWKADIVCSGLFDELVFASIRAPCLETDLQFNSAKIYIYIYVCLFVRVFSLCTWFI